jgi:glycosyltransferase involved in cell wall biosynthesis
MRIVLFTHPAFLKQQSMPRFTNMLSVNLCNRRHHVEIYSPKAYFSRLPLKGGLKKWLGYIDQFLIFPLVVKRKLKTNTNTIYVFTDHALGIWVPLTKHLPTLVICHDFLAQRSAESEIPQNPTGLTGRIYQKLIRNGYSVADNFISVSKQTQQDLHRFLAHTPLMSKVVYNGLNNSFKVIEQEQARVMIGEQINIDVSNGYILHIGGNQWYKNRIGVVKIYSAWRSVYNISVPLLLIGAVPSNELKEEIRQSAYKADIFTQSNIADEYINAAYSGALALLFPSIAEGFGWPIAEAMACGCPVITTDEAPMTEVGGDAACYITVMPLDEIAVARWATDAAAILQSVISTEIYRSEIIKKGLLNSNRFNTNNAIDEIENTLHEILQSSLHDKMQTSSL